MEPQIYNTILSDLPHRDKYIFFGAVRLVAAVRLSRRVPEKNLNYQNTEILYNRLVKEHGPLR